MMITWTTDFGADSPYVAQMKGIVLQRVPAAQFVDVTHSIPPQNVLAGALVLQDVCRHFPAGTIHVGVVDPGVGTARRLLAARADGHFLVGPDNGLWSLFLADSGEVQVVELHEPRFWRSEISQTFHGRDVMAPVAAHLALGTPLTELGPAVHDWQQLTLTEPQLDAGEVAATCILVDSFGNLITNVTQQWLRERGVQISGARVGTRDVKWVTTYGAAAPGELVCLLGSSGRVELALVNGSAACELGTLTEFTCRVATSSPQP